MGIPTTGSSHTAVEGLLRTSSEEWSGISMGSLMSMIMSPIRYVAGRSAPDVGVSMGAGPGWTELITLG